MVAWHPAASGRERVFRAPAPRGPARAGRRPFRMALLQARVELEGTLAFGPMDGSLRPGGSLRPAADALLSGVLGPGVRDGGRDVRDCRHPREFRAGLVRTSERCSLHPRIPRT